jgi:hypothetical protein
LSLKTNPIRWGWWVDDETFMIVFMMVSRWFIHNGCKGYIRVLGNGFTQVIWRWFKA